MPFTWWICSWQIFLDIKQLIVNTAQALSIMWCNSEDNCTSLSLFSIGCWWYLLTASVNMSCKEKASKKLNPPIFPYTCMVNNDLEPRLVQWKPIFQKIFRFVEDSNVEHWTVHYMKCKTERIHSFSGTPEDFKMSMAT